MSAPSTFRAHLGLDMTAHYVRNHLVAYQLRGARPVVRQNPVPPGHPDWLALEEHLNRLDGGSPEACARRLHREAFLARYRPLFDEHIPKRVPPPAPPAADKPTGEAILHLSDPWGFAICEARSPADAWPGDPARAPLGRAGFWWGSAAAPRYAGAAMEDLRPVVEARKREWARHLGEGGPAPGPLPAGV